MNTKKKAVPAFIKKPEFITIVILIIMVIVVAALQGNFFTPSSLQNTIISWTPLILLTMGQAVVIISGGLDMSSGNAMAFMLCLLAAIMKDGTDGNGVIAIVVCFVVMLLIGLLNGISVAYFKLPPIIATFATSYIYLGAALFIMPSPGGGCANWVRAFYKFSSVEGAPGALAAIGDAIPTGVFMIIGIVFMWYVISRKKLGRYIYAVGSNRNIAYDSGVKTVKVQIMAYVFDAFCCMLAALFLVGQNQSGSARLGDAMTLKSIASAIVGGVSLAGGSGNVYVTIGGAAIISLVSKLISFSGISSDYQTLASGIILLAAVSMSAVIRLVKTLTSKEGKTNV